MHSKPEKLQDYKNNILDHPDGNCSQVACIACWSYAHAYTWRVGTARPGVCSAAESMGHDMQAKKDSADLEAKSKSMKGRVAVLEEQVKGAESTLEAAVQPIGNLVHDSVPVSNDEVPSAALMPKTGLPQQLFIVDPSIVQARVQPIHLSNILKLCCGTSYGTSGTARTV